MAGARLQPMIKGWFGGTNAGALIYGETNTDIKEERAKKYGPAQRRVFRLILESPDYIDCGLPDASRREGRVA